MLCTNSFIFSEMTFGITLNSIAANPRQPATRVQAAQYCHWIHGVSGGFPSGSARASDHTNGAGGRISVGGIAAKAAHEDAGPRGDPRHSLVVAEAGVDELLDVERTSLIAAECAE
jgi:hypothetical protein